MLNRKLIEKQNLSDERVAHIEELHKILDLSLDAMNHLNPLIPNELIELKHAVQLIESLEYILQCAWGFSIDSKFHSWWFRVPHCKCPSMDNYEYVGFKERIFSGDCPLHAMDL